MDLPPKLSSGADLSWLAGLCCRYRYPGWFFETEYCGATAKYRTAVIDYPGVFGIPDALRHIHMRFS
ncbi:hypothetical protein SQ11_12095 [Nitrosospira sp. NpAV]|nr:hypothetical protein SQ11_12095 [Nitrosospira sp. NpAV]